MSVIRRGIFSQNLCLELYTSIMACHVGRSWGTPILPSPWARHFSLPPYHPPVISWSSHFLITCFDTETACSTLTPDAGLKILPSLEFECLLEHLLADSVSAHHGRVLLLPHGLYSHQVWTGHPVYTCFLQVLISSLSWDVLEWMMGYISSLWPELWTFEPHRQIPGPGVESSGFYPWPPPVFLTWNMVPWMEYRIPEIVWSECGPP